MLDSRARDGRPAQRDRRRGERYALRDERDERCGNVRSPRSADVWVRMVARAMVTMPGNRNVMRCQVVLSRFVLMCRSVRQGRDGCGDSARQADKQG